VEGQEHGGKASFRRRRSASRSRDRSDQTDQTDRTDPLDFELSGIARWFERDTLAPNMNLTPQWRQRARMGLEAYFRRHSFPRTALAIVLVITGLFGFLVSFGLLHLGLREMWMRYPMAVFAAYGLFLGLLRGWVELERARFRPQPEEIEGLLEGKEENNPGDHYSSSSHSSWLDGLDAPDFTDIDAEGCLFGILFGVAAGLIAVVVVSLINAPGLISEVFIDGFLVSVLYRRLKSAERENWLGTAVRKTFKLVLLTAILMAIGGGCLQALAPGAHSIGPAIEKIRHPQPPM
jgi:hypothetical protein